MPTRREKGAPAFSNFQNAHDFSDFEAFFGTKKEKEQEQAPTPGALSLDMRENKARNAAVFGGQKSMFGDILGGEKVSLFGDLSDEGVDVLSANKLVNSNYKPSSVYDILNANQRAASPFALGATSLTPGSFLSTPKGQGVFGRYAKGRYV